MSHSLQICAEAWAHADNCVLCISPWPFIFPLWRSHCDVIGGRKKVKWTTRTQALESKYRKILFDWVRACVCVLFSSRWSGCNKPLKRHIFRIELEWRRKSTLISSMSCAWYRNSCLLFFPLVNLLSIVVMNEYCLLSVCSSSLEEKPLRANVTRWDNEWLFFYDFRSPLVIVHITHIVYANWLLCELMLTLSSTTFEIYITRAQPIKNPLHLSVLMSARSGE